MQSPLLYLTELFVLGIAAQWLAWRMKLPAILLLLGFGFATNLWVDPTRIIDDSLLFPVVSLSVAIILFDGGLSLKLRDLKTTSSSLIRLVTIGCLITWVLGTLAARLIFSSWELAALAGAMRWTPRSCVNSEHPGQAVTAVMVVMVATVTPAAVGTA